MYIPTPILRSLRYVPHGLAVCVALAGCGDDGSSQPDAGVPPVGIDAPAPDAMAGDGVAPTVRIDYPLNGSWTGQASVIVRGQASDADGIAAIRVAGVEATSDDGFSTWRAEVPVPLDGVRVLSVESVDSAGATDPEAATLELNRSLLMLSPASMVYDGERKRVLASDMLLGSVVEVDLDSGALSVVAGQSATTDALIRAPRALAVDRAGNRLLVIDSERRELLAVNLSTGAQTTLLTNEDASSVVDLIGISAIEIDPTDANRVYLADWYPGRLLVADLTAKSISVVSSETTGAGPVPEFATEWAFDHEAQRAYATGRFINPASIVSIDLATGDRERVWNSDDVADLDPFRLHTIVFDAPRDRFLVSAQRVNFEDTDDRSEELYELDIDARALNKLPSDSPLIFDGAFHLALEGDTDNLLVFNTQQLDSLMRLNLTTGARETLLEGRIGQGPRIDAPSAFELSSDGDKLWAIQTGDPFTDQPDALFEVDLATGTRRRVDVVTSDDAPALLDPEGIAWAPDLGRLFVLDSDLSLLLSFDPSTGERTVIREDIFISDFGDTLTYDTVDERLLHLNFIDSGLSLQALSTVDGSGVEISGSQRGQGPAFGLFPAGLVIDQIGRRVYVLEEPEFGGTDRGRVLSVSLDTGNRAIVYDGNTGDGPTLENVSGFALDAENGRLFITGEAQIIEIAIDTGAYVVHQSTHSSAGLPSGPLLYDSARGVIWAGDANFPVQAVDLETEQVMLVSH